MVNRKNYFANRELDKQRKIAAGLVSDRFPKVSSIVVKMTYHQQLSNQVFMVRTVNFSPTSYAYFKMECLTKNCINGGFEFTSAISKLIKNRKKSGKGKLVCHANNDYLYSGHVRVSYEISIRYNKRSQ
jgi:hypothetical protein